MNTHDKLVAAAKRAARSHSREHRIPYQTCLDIVARQVARSSWKAFLLDPVAVDDNAIEAGSEPDFANIDPELHLVEIIRHARRLDAHGFISLPRNGGDATPNLVFTLRNGDRRPIDARGLSIEHVAKDCLPGNPMTRPTYTNISIGGYSAMPTVDGALMRTSVSYVRNVEPELMAVSATIDGSEPVTIDMPRATDLIRYDEALAARQSKALEARPRHVGPNLRQRLRRLILGRNETVVRRMIARGLFREDVGPFVAVTSSGRRLRLSEGLILLAFSPPGTGRMSGVTIPALLTDDATSYVVHDDGQLLMHTSGWRSRIGRVAVIRLDGDTVDAINPFGREWLPEPSMVKTYADRIARAMHPGRPDFSRLVAEVATVLIEENGETTIREIRDRLLSRHEGDLAREAATILAPLATPLAHAATMRSTVTPDMLRGIDGRPVTIYIERDPTLPSARHVLAAVIQEAIWKSVLGDRNPGRGLSVNTLIHDLERMPMLPSLIEAMDLGRGWRSGTIISGSTASVLESRYGADGKTMAHLAHVTMVFEQASNRDLAIIDPHGEVEWQEAATLGQGNCMAISGMVGGSARLRAAMFFEHSDTRERVWDPRTKRGIEPVDMRDGGNRQRT